MLNKPLGWTEEVTVLCWVWVVLWGASFILSDQDEIRFDIVYGPRLGARAPRLHGDLQRRAGRAVRRFAAGDLELRAVHEAREVGLPRHALRLSVLDLRDLRGRLHRQARADRVERAPRQGIAGGRRRSTTATAYDAQPLHAVHHRAGRAGGPRAADRPVDDLRLDLLPARRRARPRHRGGADPERPVQQLRAAGGAAVHPRRRPDEQRQPDRPPSQVLPRARRPLSRRPRPRQRRGQHHLRRHVGLGDRRCRRHRPHHHRHDDAQREISDRVRRGDHRVGGHHRADHPAVDPDGRLRAGLRHVDRLPVPGRRHPRADARRGVHDHEHADRAAPELSGRAAGADARDSAHHARRVSRADAAGGSAVRHLRRRDDAHRGRGRGGAVRAAGVGADLPLAVVEAALRRAAVERQVDDVGGHADRRRARLQLRGDDRERSAVGAALHRRRST